MSGTRITAYNTTTVILLVALGAALMWGAYHIPREPKSFTLTAKERCLPPTGVSFSASYSGIGTLEFVIIPPPKEGEKK